MSVYKRKRKDGSSEETYSYDFVRQGVRYTGSTEETSLRAAERFVKDLKRRIRDAPRQRDFMTMEAACVRFWEEVGQYHAGAETTLTDLGRLRDRLGGSKDISQIDGRDVAKLVAKRRGDGVAPGTVNRGTTKLLRHLLSRARDVWQIDVQRIEWGRHLLKEPQERVRELSEAEEAALLAEIRDDLRPLISFAILTGCRRQECLDLEWRHIDWHNRAFRVTGKGDKSRTIPMTQTVRDLLWPLPRAHDRVFTYVVQRGRDAGQRKPVEKEGLKSHFARAVDRAEIIDLRFHDLRHTAATRLLRSCRDIKTVQRLLGHEDINTTTKYAHVTDNDLRNALESVGPAQSPRAFDQAANVIEDSRG
ncbi:unnamed protein product [Effrenium voratum]|uniref:Tyr recombinase domain-containing protein n=1 Tax=Effrenium voratum TaxID=2562239 RepID=A0AA36N231_9DINO|nr:unnamed protein product [Effrenium voratum]